MSLRLLALTVICVVSLYGQRRHSWQDDCFNKPGLPYCQGRDYAVKKPKPSQAPPTVVTNPGARVPPTPTPSLIVIGGIDWRFADPSADALVGINYRALSTSTAGRDLLAQLGANLDGLSRVDQIALSVRGNRILALVTGAVLVTPESALKLVSVTANTMLIGHPDAVDEALQRLARKAPLSELLRSAEDRQSKSDFWVFASPGFLESQSLTAGVKRFDLTLSVQNGLDSDLVVEFDGSPNPATIRAWRAESTLEGNVAHLKVSVEGQILARLKPLAQAAKYLQAPESPKHAKPVIYGLDGGPREVN